MNHVKLNSFCFVSARIFLLLALATLPSCNRIGNNNRRSNPPNTIIYTYERGSFTGKLAENYVDFSFSYANTWQRDPETGKGRSLDFVKQQKTTSEGVTIEQFEVGYFHGSRIMRPILVQQFNDQFSRQFSNYNELSEGETKIGPYEGYEFRFRGTRTSAGRPLDIFGRVVLLSTDTGEKGAILSMRATSASKDVLSPNDVGEKGELPIIGS